MSKNDEIIKQLSDKYDYPEFAIRAVIESPFRFLRDTIRSGSLECVLIHHFGKFAVSRRIKRNMKDVDFNQSRRDYLRNKELSLQKDEDRVDSEEKKEDM